MFYCNYAMVENKKQNITEFKDFLFDNFNIKKPKKEKSVVLLNTALKNLPNIELEKNNDIERDLILQWKRSSAQNQKIALREILKKANNIPNKKHEYELHPIYMNVLVPAVLLFSFSLSMSLFAPIFTGKFVFVLDVLTKSSIQKITYKSSNLKNANQELLEKKIIKSKKTITQKMKSDYVLKNRYKILENKSNDNIVKVKEEELTGRVAGASAVNELISREKVLEKEGETKKGENRLINFLFTLAEKQKNFSLKLNEELINWVNGK